jgi:hypothetical protein
MSTLLQLMCVHVLREIGSEPKGSVLLDCLAEERPFFRLHTLGEPSVLREKVTDPCESLAA